MSSAFPSLGSRQSAFPLPTISEDTLHYALHLPPHLEPSSTAVLISEYVNSLLPTPWLWNKDAWELKVAPESSSRAQKGAGGKLEGTMRVGDAVDDEWAVVWLLREVSRRWGEIVISIRDTDGEFLLIEAANELPAWVSPDNAENRLWLADGHLHLLPLHLRSSGTSARHVPDDELDERQFDPEAYLSEEDALRAARTGKYRAGAEMESAVWERIAHYPSKLSEHLHRTNVYLPIPIARALSAQPSLVQKAVEGFYVRDPSQLRAAARMSHFPPAPSVFCSVLMTRAAYAQLQGQMFHPPRAFGPEWTVRDGEEATRKNERRWRDLGVKVATGFEIMYREGGKRGRNGTVGRDEETRQDKAYIAYIDSLKKAAFFGTELEGSEKWKVREMKALEGWKQVRSDDTQTQRPSFAYLFDTALDSTANMDKEAFEPRSDVPEDSDKWLEISPDDLDNIMMRASGQTPTQAAARDVTEVAPASKPAQPAEEHGKALAELAKKVQTFVGGEGDLQGARFEDELSDDEDINDGDDMAAELDWQDLTPAQKEERMRNLVAPLEEGEWGKKPTTTAEEDDDIIMLGSTTPTKGMGAKAAPEVPPPNIRAPRFAKQEFDGVVDESDSEEEDEADLPPPGTLGRQIAEMRWADTAPQIEEIEDDDMLDQKRDKAVRWDEGIDAAMRKKVAADHAKETGDDRPVVVNGDDDDDGVDFAQEQEEFLAFAREALGVTDEMWEGIVKNREDRGAFVPKSSKTIPANGTAAQPASATTVAASEDEQSGMRGDGEPDTGLDSFDKVMAAMDAELARAKPAAALPKASASQSTKASKKTTISGKLPSGKRPTHEPLPALPTEADLDAMSEDDLLAMDREFRAALKGAGLEDDDDELEEGLDPEMVQSLGEEDREEYRMMKNLLQSYRSQEGGSGAVGNLFGRLSEGK